MSDADVTNTVAASVYAISVGGTGNDSRPAGLTDTALKAMLSVDLGNVIDSAHTDGIIHWNFDSAPQAFDFLAAGETLQLTYTIRATDSDATAAHDDQTVVVTITGTNDAPVVAADTSGPAGSNVHAVTELFDTTGDTATPDTASGSLAFTDLDLTDTHTVDNAFVSAIWSRSPTLPSGVAGTLATALSTSIATDSTGTGTGSVGFMFSATDNNFDFLADGETLKVAYNVTVTDNDQVQSFQPVTITIHGTDDAPVVTSGDTGSVIEAVPASSVVYTGIASDPDGDTLTYSLVAGGDASAFSINSSTGVVTINNTPDFETRSSYSFTVKASDPSGLFATKVVTIHVDDLAPVISSGSTAEVNEGVSANTVVYTAAAVDPAGGPVIYSLSGTDASAFSINSSTGTVSINNTPDFETRSSYSFTVEASDPSGLFDTKVVTIDVNDLAPVVASGSTASVAEGISTSTVVYTAVASDPGGGTISYSLTGADAAKFSINSATGAVFFNAVPNFEAPADVGGDGVYDITVQAAGGALTTSRAVAITVTDLAPVISSGSTASVDEGVSAGTIVYTAAAADPAGGAVTYSLSGTDASACSVNSSTGAVTINSIPNFETKSSYSFTVKASDPSGSFNTQAVTVSVNDLPPVISSGSTAAVNEGVSANTTVYTAAATDPAGGAVTYSLVGPDASAFTINSLTGVVTINSTPDYEIQSSYDFSVKASDPSGLFNTKAVTINVNDLNDAPAITSADPQAGVPTSGLTGSSTPDEVWGSLGFVDPDLADHHTVTFSAPTLTTTSTSSIPTRGALASAFSTSINDSTGSGSGQINWYFSAAHSNFDFLGNGETLTATYDVTVRDDANATSTQSVTVTVTGSDHIPQFNGGSTAAFVTEAATESITNPASVVDHRTGTLGFSDRDRGETHTVLVSASEDGPVWIGGDVTTLPPQTLNTLAHALTATLQSDSAVSGFGTIAWNFSIADNNFDFMSAGQTLTLAYDVKVKDSYDQSFTQTVTVTVNGSNKSIIYDTLGNVHATTNSPNLALSVSNADDPSTNELAVWTPAQYHHDTGENYGGPAPLLLVNAVSGAVLVELDAIRELDFHLGNRDDTLDVPETAASPVRTVPIVADGGFFSDTGNTVVLGDAYAALSHTAFAAIFAADHTTVIGVAITHIVGGVEITDRYTNFQNFVGDFSFNSLAQQLTLPELAFVPNRADPARSSLTAVVNFAGPQETALLTLTDRDGNWALRPGDVVTWAGAGAFSPASLAAATNSHGILVDTFTPTSHTTQTVTAGFDSVTLSTSVHFVAMNTWTNTSGGNWPTAANWSGNAVPPSAEAVWIGNAGNYTVNVPNSQSIYGLGTMATATLNLSNVLDVTGTGNSVIAGALVTTGSGRLLAEHGTVNLNGAVTNNAVIKAEDGATINIAGNVTGTGTIVVDGGYLNVTGSLASTQAITVDGAGMLVLDDAPASGLTVHDFSHGDSIVLANLAYTAYATLSWNTSTNTLTVTSEGGASESIKFGESHSLSDFALTADPLGTGGIDLVYNNTSLNYAQAVSSTIITAPQDLQSDGAFMGGINDAGIAVVNSSQHDYFFVNGHLITVADGLLSTTGRGTAGDMFASGINNAQTVIHTGVQSGNGLPQPQTYKGTYDPLTNLFNGSGGVAGQYAGPSELHGPAISNVNFLG